MAKTDDLKLTLSCLWGLKHKVEKILSAVTDGGFDLYNQASYKERHEISHNTTEIQRSLRQMDRGQTRSLPAEKTKDAKKTDDLDQWTPGMDPTLKKRIQNRLSQRTYRSRLRHRIEELEQQVQAQMNTRTTAPTENNSDDGQQEELASMMQDQEVNLLGDWAGPAVNTSSTCQHLLGPGPDMGLLASSSGSSSSNNSNNNNVVTPPFDESAFILSGPIILDPMAYTPRPPGEEPKGSHAILWRDGPWQRADPAKTMAAAPSKELTPSQIPPERTSPRSARMTDEKHSSISSNSNNNYSSSSSSNNYKHHRAAAPSTARPSSQYSTSDGSIPNADAALEDRFAWLLVCARRVGFEGLDDLALQYYTRDFDAKSSLALEQRMSRNRSLPAMVAQLRQSSRLWPTWQSRAYLDEILKSAEEICERECNELSKQLAAATTTGQADIVLTEIALQDKMPRLWAFLTRLASTSLDRHLNPSQVVYVSLLILCGVRSDSPFWSHIDQGPPQE